MSNEEYFRKKRESAKTETGNDLKKTVEHLLEDIHDESLAVPQEREPGLTVSRTMSRFAALQIALSKQADATATKNLKLQRLTFGIALVALLISIIQLAIPFVKKEEGLVTNEDFIEVRYQRNYRGEALKEFEKTHDVPQPFPKREK